MENDFNWENPYISTYRGVNVNFEELLGKTLSEIKISANEDEMEPDKITFICNDGSCYILVHDQDCYEYVYIESIVGDVENLLNTPITMAELVTRSNESCEWWEDSKTWSFYKLATTKAYVTIRWLGESNGYYSEEVSFLRVK